jgi:hypothetical protein
MPAQSVSRTPTRSTRTISESGVLIGCAYSSVVELIERGELAVVKASNRRLVLVASLERLLGKSITDLERNLQAA